jgi:hypothetical protein
VCWALAVSKGRRAISAAVDTRRPKVARDATSRDRPATHGLGRRQPSVHLLLGIPKAALNDLARKAKESVALTLTAANANGTSRATASIAGLKAA